MNYIYFSTQQHITLPSFYICFKKANFQKSLKKMGTDEMYSLKWNKFESAATATLKSLHSDLDFTDVTLACEDDQQIESHKVILSAASPFFHRY